MFLENLSKEIAFTVTHRVSDFIDRFCIRFQHFFGRLDSHTLQVIQGRVTRG